MVLSRRVSAFVQIRERVMGKEKSPDSLVCAD